MKNGGGPHERPANGRGLWREFDERLPAVGLGALAAGAWGGLATWAPAVQVRETADAVLVALSLPGFDRRELRLTVEDRMLTVHAGRRARVRDGADSTGRERSTRTGSSRCGSRNRERPKR